MEEYKITNKKSMPIENYAGFNPAEDYSDFTCPPDPKIRTRWDIKKEAIIDEYKKQIEEVQKEIEIANITLEKLRELEETKNKLNQIQNEIDELTLKLKNKNKTHSASQFEIVQD